MPQSETITVYTDGGCNPNPGPGGWAAILVTPEGDEQALSGGDRDTTNNRMELTAALQAITATPQGSRVVLYTDSQYLRKGITEWLANWQRRGWKKRDGSPVLNQDLWQALVGASQHRDVTWRWVRGHAGNHYNERVDRLARAAIPRMPTTAPDSTVTRIYLRVSCVGTTGGWAARILDGVDIAELYGRVTSTTSNRLILQAAVAAIDHAQKDVLTIYTVSDYLYKGITQWVDGWRKRSWATSTGTPVKNADLWKQLLQRCNRHQITWQWIRDVHPPEYKTLRKLATDARKGKLNTGA